MEDIERKKEDLYNDIQLLENRISTVEKHLGTNTDDEYDIKLISSNLKEL